MTDEALSLLLKNQNADGGWGAVAGKKSNTEVTALGLMALKSAGRDEAEPARKAEKWLIERQSADGSWPLNDDMKAPSWSTALAMIALGDSRDVRERLVKAGNWALQQEGSKPGILAQLILAFSFKRKPVELNEDLIGWSWTPVSFSWVEPTSYFLIALKKLKGQLPGKVMDERIQQGEMMIYDRMCENGGWNYGNAAVYGDRLWPYPDTTAIALIALQDHPERKENQLSLSTLEQTSKTTDSGLALAWGLLVSSLYKRDGSMLKARLAERFGQRQFLGEHKPIALSILAMSDGARFFRL